MRVVDRSFIDAVMPGIILLSRARYSPTGEMTIDQLRMRCRKEFAEIIMMPNG